MHAEYKGLVIKQLRDQQARYAPREKKIEQIERAEELLREIDDSRTYTYEYICFRVTGYRPDSTPQQTASGEEVRHDLRLFIEDLSESAKLRIEEANERVCTVDELSHMFNVSTKTISRWRDKGLMSRRFMFDGRSRIGFLESAVDRFVQDNRVRIERGERFSQITDHERDEIVRRARRLAAAGGSSSEVARRIARRMNRSIEAVRYTLKQFDERNPDLAIFPYASAPLDEVAKERIYTEYRRGTPVETIAKQHSRTRTAIYSALNEIRARRIAELPMDFMHNECFEEAKLEDEILAEMPENDKAAKKSRMPAGLPPYLAALYEMPLLTKPQEQHLFRKFNYLKFKASRLREGLDSRNPKPAKMDEIEQLYESAMKVKNKIVKSNLRLVVSIAKRHVSSNHSFFELVSDGNMSLIRAVEKFDYARGNKFSTYASWAIMKNFARTVPDEFKHRDRFRTSHDEMFAASEDHGSSQYFQESTQKLHERQVGHILSRLDDREKKIIVSRFGLDHSQEPQTLKEVGKQLGVTKERIRQIEARALNKLRVVAREEKIEVPGD